ncbi:winged helix-turn-helix transcriptional regulator [Chryseobacterium jejuense]|uniref:winged helix-turn-helix transcriptional regulator n=1 Tax=Chryseobacterium jejuense TaxID=445960 RepID=UPI001AE4150D|nr:helix-turn-helix domain-containing protein [Chryseobacterium jejuense]MBP2619555.1 DNA-binding HxlR family transcriptional regulator [Chryseobacterium jejuense]
MSEIEKIETVCPSDVFLQVIKGKCKTTIIVLIKKKRNRFTEMKKTLPTISERTIAKQLNELESDGIITRKVFNEVPLRVEYYLTEYGESIYPIVREMRKWGYMHLQHFKGDNEKELKRLGQQT